jgi:hypothetical protein
MAQEETLTKEVLLDAIRGLATKEDLERFGERFATKEDLERFGERFATKEDLDRFATKEDLDRFATKEDLDRFATKDDLERFATKDDLLHLRHEMQEFARDIETRILTAFHGYGRGQSARMHTLESTDHDVALRLAALEDRVLNLETVRGGAH